MRSQKTNTLPMELLTRSVRVGDEIAVGGIIRVYVKSTGGRPELQFTFPKSMELHHSKRVAGPTRKRNNL